MMLLESLAQASFTMLRQANRKHDLVAVQVTDPRELELPELGRLIFQDAETGEIVEVNTGDARKRKAFAERQAKSQEQLARLFRKAGIDAIQLRTDQPYGVTLGRFFENARKTEAARMNIFFTQSRQGAKICFASLRLCVRPRHDYKFNSTGRNDIRDIKPPMEISTGWAWLWWVLAFCWPSLRSRISGLALVEESENEYRSCRPPIPAHVRAKQKLAEALALDFAAEAVCHRGFGHGAILSGRAFSISRAGADDGGIFARAGRNKIAVAGAKGKPRQFSRELRSREIRQIRAGRK